MLTTKTKTSACECGALHDYATSVEGDQRPKPGDPSICICCGAVNKFTEDLGIMPMTLQEVEALHPETIREIGNAQRDIRILNERRQCRG